MAPYVANRSRDTRGRTVACTYDAVMGALRSHSTKTSTASWRGPKAEAALPDDDARAYRQAYAWVDPDGDPARKASYKFIHHEVSGGKVGAANAKACTSGIGILNGGRGGTKIPHAHRKGVWNHLARHLRDAGEEPAPLRD